MESDCPLTLVLDIGLIGVGCCFTDIRLYSTGCSLSAEVHHFLAFVDPGGIVPCPSIRTCVVSLCGRAALKP